MPTPRTIRVFIASPGDLAVERRAFKDVLEKLNGDFGDALNITFEPLGWEDTLAVIRPRSQETINQDIDRCDVFILAMHRRWGQDAPDAKPYTSYTEEEFHRALNRWKKKPKGKKPRAPEIFVFFKHIDPASMADAGPQLQKVLEFRRQLEETRQVLYHGFADEAEFKAEVDRHLRAFAKDELPKADAPRDKVVLPLEVLAEVRKERAEKEAALAKAEKEHQTAEAAIARAEALALAMAERASKAALEGRVEEARQDFAKATDGTANVRVLFLAYEFYVRTGDLATAEELLERWLAISGPDAENAETAAAWGNLGLIYETRSELDRAEEMQRKSLATQEKLGLEDSIANQYGNLGVIYRTRGDLDRAEEMQWKALAIDKKLNNQEGMAADYGNLGEIYRTRGDLHRAEEMQRKSLDMHEVLGNQQNMASNYGNLGAIYQTLGDLDRAEEMHGKSLSINEKLGRREGMAANYGNLGLIYRGRGDLDGAEEMHRKSLAIEEKLGRQDGMAHDYANLGLVAKDRGDLERARELWTKACDLFDRIGMPHMVKQIQEWLDSLPKSAAKATWVTGAGAGSKGAAKGKKKADSKPKGTRKGKKA